MKIVVIGLGKVGRSLSKNLCDDGHDVTVIDNQPQLVYDAVNSMDVQGICGNGASYEIQSEAKVEEADLLIANLLIEYIGYEAFQKAVSKVRPKYCSCVIQINTDTKQWVSDSPYLHAFDRLDEVHHQMEEDALEKAMKEIGYSLIHRSIETLPNGKALVRMDFSR